MFLGEVLEIEQVPRASSSRLPPTWCGKATRQLKGLHKIVLRLFKVRRAKFWHFLHDISGVLERAYCARAELQTVLD
jgi:hypothetical protein